MWNKSLPLANPFPLIVNTPKSPIEKIAIVFVGSSCEALYRNHREPTKNGRARLVGLGAKFRRPHMGDTWRLVGLSSYSPLGF